MKEETPLQPQSQQLFIYRAEIRSIQPSSPASDWPCARFKHQTFIYRGKLYLHGGTSIPGPEFSDDPLDLFCFALEGEAAGKWQKLRGKVSGGKELQAVSAHAAVLNGSKWYIFGGSNSECKPNNVLLRLNVESLEWTRLQQRGEVPSARECAHLSFLQKNWLVLYGGISTSELDVYNTFHFYNVDTRNWSHCQGAYQFHIYPRMDPALCHLKDKLYLFGGSYRALTNNQERYLDDLYQITLTPPGSNLAGRVQARRLAGPTGPQARSGHGLLGVGQHHLMLLGGEDTCSQLREGVRFEDVSLVQNMWLFDTRTSVWGRVQLSDRSFQYRTMTSCFSLDNKLYLFGGLHSYSSVLKDLVEISIDPRELTQPKSRIVACPECHQRRRFPAAQRHVAAEVIEEIAEGIDFPFAAVGLLIDNCMNSGASLLKISYFHQYGSQKMRFIKFEDDARLSWTDEQLFETLAHFNAGMMHVPSGTDKKIKAGLLKDAFRREYGYNLKVASLRLGEGFLFISYHEQNSQFRVCLFEKQGRDTPEARYALQFYIYNMLQRSVSSPQMQQARQRISDKFGDLLQSVFYLGKCRNTLLVLSPRVQDSKKAMEAADGEELQLKADVDNSNILNGPILKIRELQRAGLLVQQCVDVSLRAYITCLYLKNECMKIMLSVREAVAQPVEVQTQSFLEKVDRLCKHKHVLQINPALQFDLKINELYYLYDLKKKLSFFNNGLLIYHKNRLLMRYKYPLGELLQRKYYKRPLCHNFLRLFGFLELPEHIPVNFLKTNYLQHAMMERLFSRLKLISKLFKRELQRMAADPDHRRPAPTRLNQQEAQQEKNQTIQPNQPRRKSETAPREMSLRRTKTPQRDLLEGLQARMKQLLKDPTSENIKELIKLVEANSGTKEELDYFHKNKYKLLGPLAPVGRPLSNKTAQIQRMRQAARDQAQPRQKREADGQNWQLKGNSWQKKQQLKEMLAQGMGKQQKNENGMMDEGQIVMQQASSSSSDEQSQEEAVEMPQKQQADI